VLLETDGNGNTQVTYTQTPDIYGQIVSQRRSNTTTFYHHDALGSTLALTNSSETVTDSYRFYAFGGTLTNSGSTINPYQYVGNLGYYNEPALSLQYLRARYYQPSMGRFVSPDPISFADNYIYVSNNPATGPDPSGLLLMPVWCAGSHRLYHVSNLSPAHAVPTKRMRRSTSCICGAYNSKQRQKG